MSEKIEFNLIITKNELEKALNNAAESAKVAGDSVAKASGKVRELKGVLGQVSDEANRLRASFLGNIGANLVAKGMQTLGAAFNKVVDDTREFSRVIAEINSTLPVTSKLTKDQENAIAALSERFGTSAASQAKGFFEVVSNGVEDSAVAFRILAAANNAALSGLVDVNTAAQLITTTFNAYRNSGVTVAQVTDTLVAVTQASGAKFEELSQSMGRVTNVAAQSGISIGELGGAIAFLNSRSLTTEQAITGLAGSVTSISKPSDEARVEANRLGLSFSASALKAKGLTGFLKDVAVATNGNIESIRRLFPEQRAANAVIAIATSNFDEYSKVVDKVTNSQGEATRAAKIIKESFDFKVSELSSSFNAFALTLGNVLVPAIGVATSALKALKAVIGGTPASIDENRNKLKLLADEYNKTKDRIDAYNKSAIGASSPAKLALEERLNEIIAERNKLRASSPIETTEGKATVAVSPEEELASIDLRKNTFRQLTLAQAEFDLFNENRRFDLLNAGLIATEEDYQRFLVAERAKIDAQFLLEEEKNSLIQNAQVKRDAIAATALKKNLLIAQSAATKEAAISKSKTDEEIRLLTIKNNYVQASAQLATGFLKEGSIAAFAIQKAAALAGIYVQDASARATAVAAATAIDVATLGVGGPIYLAKQNALITSNTAVALAGVAASAIKGFANGGIVGATTGNDNQVASIRTGEMVLNAQQQKNLMEMINSGGGGGDIIIQIDGRTVATAVRNQIKAGFNLGVA